MAVKKSVETRMRKRLAETICIHRMGLLEEWLDPDNLPKKLPTELLPSFLKKKSPEEIEDINTCINDLTALGCHKGVLHWCLRRLGHLEDDLRLGVERIRVSEEEEDQRRTFKYSPRKELKTKEDMKTFIKQVDKTLADMKDYDRELMWVAEALDTECPLPQGGLMEPDIKAQATALDDAVKAATLAVNSATLAVKAVEDAEDVADDDKATDEMTFSTLYKAVKEMTLARDAIIHAADVMAPNAGDTLTFAVDAMLQLKNSLCWVRKLAKMWETPHEKKLLEKKGPLYLLTYVSMCCSEPGTPYHPLTSADVLVNMPPPQMSPGAAVEIARLLETYCGIDMETLAMNPALRRLQRESPKITSRMVDMLKHLHAIQESGVQSGDAASEDPLREGGGKTAGPTKKLLKKGLALRKQHTESTRYSSPLRSE